VCRPHGRQHRQGLGHHFDRRRPPDHVEVDGRLARTTAVHDDQHLVEGTAPSACVPSALASAKPLGSQLTPDLSLPHAFDISRALAISHEA
jgi:hypothetical protein